MLKTEQAVQAIQQAVRAGHDKDDAAYCAGMVQTSLEMAMEDISKAHAMLERGNTDGAMAVLASRFRLCRDVMTDYAERNG